MKIYCISFPLLLILTCTGCKKPEPKKVEAPVPKTENKVRSETINCYESEKYFVIGKEVELQAGTDFLVKTKPKADQKFPCVYKLENGDYEIKNEWAEYFAGLKKHLLILDSTTGPGPSGLTIWDLDKRKKVFEGSWSDSEQSTDDTLVYWTGTAEATISNCPKFKEWQKMGLGGLIETKEILDLRTLKVTKTKLTRCISTQ